MRSCRRRFCGVNRTKAVEERVETRSVHAAVGYKVGKAHPVDLRSACRIEQGAGGGGGEEQLHNKLHVDWTCK